MPHLAYVFIKFDGENEYNKAYLKVKSIVYCCLPFHLYVLIWINYCFFSQSKMLMQTTFLEVFFFFVCVCVCVLKESGLYFCRKLVFMLFLIKKKNVLLALVTSYQ